MGAETGEREMMRLNSPPLSPPPPPPAEEEEGVGAADGALVGVSTNATTSTSVALDRVRMRVRALLEFWLVAIETWVRMAVKRVEPPFTLRMAALEDATSLSEEETCSAVSIVSLEPTISYVATIDEAICESILLLALVREEAEENEVDAVSSGSEMNKKGM